MGRIKEIARYNGIREEFNFLMNKFYNFKASLDQSVDDITTELEKILRTHIPLNNYRLTKTLGNRHLILPRPPTAARPTTNESGDKI